MTGPAVDGPGGGPVERVRAHVDRDECFGFAFCVETLPEVFALDAEGRSVAADVDADPDRLAAAVDACPRAAISLIRSVAPPAAPPGTEGAASG